MIPFRFAVPLDGAQWPPPPCPEGWVDEVKLDGHRASCSPDGEVRSRSGRLMLVGGFGDVTLGPKTGLWLDGEVYAGTFVAFDCPQLPSPYSVRRQVLRDGGVIFVSDYRDWMTLAPSFGRGEEGIVRKRLDAPYPSGPGPSADWVKYRQRPGYGQAGRTP